MIRSGQNIRLTAAEKVTLAAITGFPVDPRTVTEINKIVLAAKANLANLEASTPAYFDEDGFDQNYAEFRLVSAVADSFLVEA